MKWSQLKKRIEESFADSVRGRVEVWNTRYRRAHDDAGEAWITIDKQRVFRTRKRISGTMLLKPRRAWAGVPG